MQGWVYTDPLPPHTGVSLTGTGRNDAGNAIVHGRHVKLWWGASRKHEFDVTSDAVRLLLAPYDAVDDVLLPPGARHAFATVATPQGAAAAIAALDRQRAPATPGLTFAGLFIRATTVAAVPAPSGRPSSVAGAWSAPGTPEGSCGGRGGPARGPHGAHSPLDVVSGAVPPVPGLRLIHDFISPDEEAKLLMELDACPWAEGMARRVQHFGVAFDYVARAAASPAAAVAVGVSDGIDGWHDYPAVADGAAAPVARPMTGLVAAVAARLSRLLLMGDAGSASIANTPQPGGVPLVLTRQIDGADDALLAEQLVA
jgi:hypothetical protein